MNKRDKIAIEKHAKYFHGEWKRLISDSGNDPWYMAGEKQVHYDVLSSLKHIGYLKSFNTKELIFTWDGEK